MFANHSDSYRQSQHRNALFSRSLDNTARRPKSTITVKKPSFNALDGQDIQYLHAFTSLISLGELGFCEHPLHCTIKQEKGWNTENYLYLHQRLVKHIKRDNQDLPTSFLNWQLDLMNGLLSFETRKVSIKDSVRNLPSNSSVLYPWGPDNHRVYIEFWKKSDVVQVSIFNLGGGLLDSDIHDGQARPFRLEFELNRKGQESLDRYINNLEVLKDIHVIEQEQGEMGYVDLGPYGIPQCMTENDFYTKYLYNNNRVDCTGRCLPEIIQPTENCVVKNLLFAIRQDCIDRCGFIAGDDLYQRFYLKMINASLESAAAINHTLTINTLNTADDLCKMISASQQSFLGVGCASIMQVLNNNNPNVLAYNETLNEGLNLYEEVRYGRI